MFRWNKLTEEAHPILDDIIADWRRLLDRRAKEECYQQYLRDNAGFFLSYPGEVCLLISKLRLGAEFTTDFVVGRDQHSNGLWYELIEIETPYDSPFTKRGDPSAKLYHAIQQVQNWRRWLIDNRRPAHRLLPSYGVRTTHAAPNFNFTIIIGRREQCTKWLDRRNDLARQLKINIRSFDYLTDRAEQRYFPTWSHFGSTEEGALTPWARNMMANPFCTAYSDHDWREIIREPRYVHHFFCLNAEILLETRTYSTRFDQFKKYAGVALS